MVLATKIAQTRAASKIEGRALQSLSQPTKVEKAGHRPDKGAAIFSVARSVARRVYFSARFQMNSLWHLVSPKKHYYFFEPSNPGVTNPIMQHTIRTSRFYGGTNFIPFHYYIHPSLTDVSIFVIPGYIATLYIYVKHEEYRHPEVAFAPMAANTTFNHHNRRANNHDPVRPHDKFYTLSQDTFHSIIGKGWQLAPNAKHLPLHSTPADRASRRPNGPHHSHHAILLDGGSAADVHIITAFVDFLNNSLYAPAPFRDRNRQLYHQRTTNESLRGEKELRYIDASNCMGQQPQRQLQRERLVGVADSQAVSGTSSDDQGLKLSLVCSTHAHPDHAGGAEAYMMKHNIPCTMTPHSRQWYDGFIGGTFQLWLDIVLAVVVGMRANPRMPLFKSYYRLPKDGAKGLVDVKDGDSLRVGSSALADLQEHLGCSMAPAVQVTVFDPKNANSQTQTIDLEIKEGATPEINVVSNKENDTRTGTYSNLAADVTAIGDMVRMSQKATRLISSNNDKSLTAESQSPSTASPNPFDWQVIYCPGHTNHMYLLYLPAGKLLYASDMMILNTTFIKQQRKKRLKHSNMLLPIKWRKSTEADAPGTHIRVTQPQPNKSNAGQANVAVEAVAVSQSHTTLGDKAGDFKNKASVIAEDVVEVASEEKEIVIRTVGESLHRPLKATQNSVRRNLSAPPATAPVSSLSSTVPVPVEIKDDGLPPLQCGHINIARGSYDGDDTEDSSIRIPRLTSSTAEAANDFERNTMSLLDDTPFNFAPRQQLSNAQLFEVQNIAKSLMGDSKSDKKKARSPLAAQIIRKVRRLNPLKVLTKRLTSSSSHHELDSTSKTFSKDVDPSHSSVALSAEEDKEESTKTKAHIWWWSHLFDKAPFKVVAPVPIECPEAYQKSLDLLAQYDVRTLMFPHGEVVSTEYLAGTMTFKKGTGRRLHHRHMYDEDWAAVDKADLKSTNHQNPYSEEEQERLRAQRIWHGILEECRYKAGDTLFARTWLCGYNTVLKKDGNWVMK